jgi:hypothetical protein
MDLEQRILEKFPLRITAGALEKANIYARLARLDGKTVEAYMHLVGDDIIEDVVLTKEQYVGEAFCQPTTLGLQETYKELEETTISGWCHSHGDFGNFFSSMDKANVRSFSHMGGIHKELDGVPLDIFYNIVVNARNDAPYAALSYHYEGKIGLIEDVPIVLLPEGTILSDQAANEHIKSALRHPCAEFVPLFEFNHLQPDRKMLEQLVGKSTYKERIQEAREQVHKEPQAYSPHFLHILDTLDGKQSRLWVDRSAEFFVYYLHQAPTMEEKDTVKELLASNTYLEKNTHIRHFLEIIVEVSYAARSSSAPLGNRKAAQNI